jgi:hypothetical protein
MVVLLDLGRRYDDDKVAQFLFCGIFLSYETGHTGWGFCERSTHNTGRYNSLLEAAVQSFRSYSMLLSPEPTRGWFVRTTKKKAAWKRDAINVEKAICFIRPGKAF